MRTLVKIIKYSVLGLVSLCCVVAVIVGVAGYTATPADKQQTPAGYSRNISQYVTMPDGVKLAVDIWFPTTLETGKRYPVALNMTRYWRANGVTVFSRGLQALGVSGMGNTIGQQTNWFNDAGYVVMRVDARGSGASFGVRKVEWSREEIQDYGAILKWVADQSWSNGKVGSYGVSYEGNTAEMIAVTGRPELKIVAPLYNDFNPFLGLTQPGGAKITFLDDWGPYIHYMDENDLCSLIDVSGLKCLMTKVLVTGVKPVEGQEDLLPLAVADHKENQLITGADKGVDFLDDIYGTSGYTTKDFSPFGHQTQIEASSVPMVIHTGWYDSATVEGALSRYMTFSNDQHLVIGPFSHGGRFNTDQFMATDTDVSPSSQEQYQSLITYFDMFLKGDSTALTPNKKITYYTNGADRWSTTDTWPPAGFKQKTYYFAPDGNLAENVETVPVSIRKYSVDFTASNGTATRWQTIGGPDVIYPDRALEADKLLTYMTGVFSQPYEITGAVEVSMNVSSSHKDNMFLVYLEDVDPDGKITYITEGVIRGVHRKVVDKDTLPYKINGVAHSYLRKDAMPIIPGEVTNISFNLLPISVQVDAGHRLRVSIAGADKVVFRRWPEEGIPEWTIYQGGVAASSITVPIKHIQ